MDSRLKQRLVGAAVLVALAVIFLPMLVKGPAPDSGVSDLSLDLPDRPQSADTVTRDLPLVAPRPRSGDEGALGLGARARDGSGPVDGTLPTVDTADAPHPDAARLASEQPEQEPGPADPVAGTGEPGDAPGASSEEPEAAPEPDPEPALPATTAGGDYAVRFGSYGSSVNADTVVNRLREAGLPAGSTRAEVAGRSVWRVHIGPYASRAQAEAVRVRAATVGTNDARVVALDVAPAQPRSEEQQADAAATAPEPAAATPAAAPDVGFVVQLGAFANATDANALRDRMRQLGFSAFTDTVDTERGVLTRVKAGPVVSRAEAERLKSQINDRTQVDGMVRSHP
ncbi:MAG: SPOR domain-containing protein [Luteimonas sp.]